MSDYVMLRSFKADELYLDAEETKAVLKFFFPADAQFVDSLTITDHTRGFTQGLLVQAIDSSYSMGFIDILYRVSSSPANGPMKIIKSFTKKAAKHWFKHAKAHDLINVKIYESVRAAISVKFRSVFFNEVSKLDEANRQYGAVLAVNNPTRAVSNEVWC
ncbi:hypothetical protein WH50_19160 [Pokkaliibacter plantistimulans]|uniref:Uncharacterized protein n=1 Tax=Pokkaliibacter plantistimulans TaxID=1635171 RepID=A0ABX5LSZ2_9GAMM|nr:hypothetical protein [Pokkaliibacter plantistimulans]PXF29767.1 hypothetical protein WH50_19160 [Pokkaliibacter plantistimulans]